MTEHGEGERGEHVENYRGTDKDFPGREIELIDAVVEPAHHDVIDES